MEEWGDSLLTCRVKGYYRPYIFMSELNIYTQKYRVDVGDTDFTGVVYHIKYLDLCERARSEFRREKLGITFDEIDKKNSMFVAKKINSHFIKSAYFEDLLTVSVVPYKAFGASLYLYQTISNEKGELIYAQVALVVLIDKDTHLPTNIPEEYLNKFQEFIIPPEKLKMRVKF